MNICSLQWGHSFFRTLSESLSLLNQSCVYLTSLLCYMSDRIVKQSDCTCVDDVTTNNATTESGRPEQFPSTESRTIKTKNPSNAYTHPKC